MPITSYELPITAVMSPQSLDLSPGFESPKSLALRPKTVHAFFFLPTDNCQLPTLRTESSNGVYLQPTLSYVLG